MAARLIRCAVAQVFRPTLICRRSYRTVGLSSSRPLGSKTNTQSLWWVDQHKKAVEKQLGRPYCSAALPSVYTAPPQPLDRETSSNGPNTIASVQLDLKKKLLQVSWQDGSAESQAYPFVWLRDNCHCPLCFHPTALGRLPSTTQYLNIEVTAESVEISPSGAAFTVQWDDGHKSEFLSHWLRHHRFDQSPNEPLINPKPSLWGSDYPIQFFDFNQVLEDDRALYAWLIELVTRGVAVFRGVSAEVGQVSKLGQRVADYMRTTTYGPTWHVKTKQDPSSVGYTTGLFALHTDYTSMTNMPGVLLLHCIEQTESEGGDSLLVDGFKVAMDLKKSDPEAFRLLTTYKFDYAERGSDLYGRFYIHCRHPTIRLDDQDEVEQIAISNHSRDSLLRAPVDQILPLYRAFYKYFAMLQLPENMIQYKLQKGDLLTTDNRRVLHGRTSFEMKPNNVRHLEGGYVEWDELKSRLRVLTMQLQKNTTDK